jgi:hypothetical protein
MKPSHKFAAGIIASLGLGLAVATAYANPGQMGGGMEHGKGDMQHGAKGGMQHGAQGGMQHGAKSSMQHGGQGGMQGGMGGGAQHGAGHSLMTPEERTALQEKMRNARTPEERQQIATATRTEMQKRAQEKGITPHEGRGPRAGTRPQAPASTEHQH